MSYLNFKKYKISYGSKEKKFKTWFKNRRRKVGLIISKAHFNNTWEGKFCNTLNKEKVKEIFLHKIRIYRFSKKKLIMTFMKKNIRVAKKTIPDFVVPSTLLGKAGQFLHARFYQCLHSGVKNARLWHFTLKPLKKIVKKKLYINWI